MIRESFRSGGEEEKLAMLGLGFLNAPANVLNQHVELERLI